jgi:hypothetical protein
MAFEKIPPTMHAARDYADQAPFTAVTPSVVHIQAQHAIASGADPAQVNARLNQITTGAPAPAPAPAPVPAPAPAPYNTGVVPPGTPNSTVPAPTPAPAPAPTPAPATTPSVQSLTDLIRQTPGYAFRLQQGLDGINTSAYMRGYGNSGAVGKALESYGQNLADNYYQTYLNNVMQVANQGAGAASSVAGVSQNYGNNVNGINQSLADVLSKGAQTNGAANAQMWNGIAGSLGNLFGSNPIKGL